MIRWMALGVFLASQPVVQPPKQSYDLKKNETTYSSGDIRTGGLTGISAEFTFPGKTFSVPAEIVLGIGRLRIHHGDKQPDSALIQWSQVERAEIRFGSQTVEAPAKPGWQVSKNSMVQLFYGHAVEEFADVRLTPEQFHQICEAKQFSITLAEKIHGPSQWIEERQVAPAQMKALRQLDRCLSSREKI